MSDDLFKAEMDVLFPGYERNVILQQEFMSHPYYDRYRNQCPELGRTHPWALVEVACKDMGERVTGLVVLAEPIPGGWDLKQNFEIFIGAGLLTGGFRTIDPAQLEVTLIGTIPGQTAMNARSDVVPLLNLLAVLTANWSEQPEKALDFACWAGRARQPEFPECFIRLGDPENEEYGLIIGGRLDARGEWDLSHPVQIYLDTGERITLAPGETALIEFIHGDEPAFPPRPDCDGQGSSNG